MLGCLRAFLYSLSLFLMCLFRPGVIQGRWCLPLLSLDGIKSFMHLLIKCVIMDQFSSTVLSSGKERRNSVENLCTASLSPWWSALWNWKIFLDGFGAVLGLPENVKDTMLWSEMPGWTQTYDMRPGLEVMTRSKTLPDTGRVISLTTWTSECSSKRSRRNWWYPALDELEVEQDSQLMSGRLTFPPMIMFGWLRRCFDIRLDRECWSCSRPCFRLLGGR